MLLTNCETSRSGELLKPVNTSVLSCGRHFQLMHRTSELPLSNVEINPQRWNTNGTLYGMRLVSMYRLFVSVTLLYENCFMSPKTIIFVLEKIIAHGVGYRLLLGDMRSRARGQRSQ